MPRPAHPCTLLEALVRRPSITPDDAGCQALVAERLQPLGFTATPLRFGAVDNLWLRFGAEAPLLVFAGHTDVVPPGPRAAWRNDPFVPTHHNGLLYGRGAADMKGGVAAMVCAIERFLRAQPAPRGSIAVLLTSDEEGPAQDGTRRVVQWLQEQKIDMDWCLLGEPSSDKTAGDQIRIGRRGSLTGMLRVHGRQGHVAYPEAACNPVHHASTALHTLCQRRWDDGNQHYPPTSMQIVDLHAGDGTRNVIPGQLDLVLNFRHGTASPARTLQAAVKDILEESRVAHTLEWAPPSAPFLSKAGALRRAVCAASKTVTGREPALSTGGGTSDGRFIAPTGTEVVEIGPVHATIHQANECVSVDELETLCRIYELTLDALLAQSA